MNIDEMPAGIELDVLVVEALGYVRENCQGSHEGGFAFIVADGLLSLSNGVHIKQIARSNFVHFAPSVDIAAAWGVVAQITAAFFLEHLFTVGDSWCARFEDRGDGTWQDEIVVRAVAPTAPLAICRAALKVMAEAE